MGSVKEEMKSSTPAKDDSVVSKIANKIRGSKGAAPGEPAPKTFFDHLTTCHEKLNELIITKQAEFKAERGDEAYNLKAAAMLQTMAHHIESAILLADDYTKLRG